MLCRFNLSIYYGLSNTVIRKKKKNQNTPLQLILPAPLPQRLDHIEISRSYEARILETHRPIMSSSSAETDRTVYDHETRNMAATEPSATEGHLEQKAPTTASSSSEKHQTSDTAKDAEKGNPAGNDASITDPNLVDWDGPDDPANPRNWSKTFKMANVLLVSLSVLYCNLATTMFSPGAKLMQSEFGFKSDTVEILSITIASLGFAVGQFFVPPISEVFGRVPVYRGSSIFYLGFTAGCARSTNVAEFLVFRLCTGLSAASYMSTGGGTVADLLPKEERGVAMALFTAGPLLGPVCYSFNTVKERPWNHETNMINRFLALLLEDL